MDQKCKSGTQNVVSHEEAKGHNLDGSRTYDGLDELDDLEDNVLITAMYLSATHAREGIRDILRQLQCDARWSHPEYP